MTTSIGIGVAAFSRGLREGRSGVSAITAFDVSGFPSDKGCEVRDFEPEHWIRRLNPQKIGRASQFCLAASRMAIEDAGIDEKTLAQSDCGVVIGTTDGESQALEELTKRWLARGGDGLAPERIPRVSADNLANSVAREFALHGEAVTVSTACAAGNYAIGMAYDMISGGEADYMLCGGGDAICRKTFAGFLRLGTIAPSMCQPFDAEGKGILTGEGAGMLLLESLDHARARRARAYAEIVGYGLNCDAGHTVSPDGESIAECMRLAHRHAGIQASAVDYICAHGTGTRANDSTEAMAIREVFAPQPPPTSSIKSMLGHTMGAASALGAIACCLALSQGFIPPTINCNHPNAELGLDFVANRSRPAQLGLVQNNAFAFGGNNAILILGKHDR